MHDIARRFPGTFISGSVLLSLYMRERTMPKTVEQRLLALEKTISDFLFGKTAKKPVRAKRTAKKAPRKTAKKKSKKAAR
jgi:hypothetical protein